MSINLPDEPGRERSLAIMNEAARLIEAVQDSERLIASTYTAGLGESSSTPDEHEIHRATRVLIGQLSWLKARAGVMALAAELDPQHPVKMAVMRVVR